MLGGSTGGKAFQGIYLHPVNQAGGLAFVGVEAEGCVRRTISCELVLLIVDATSGLGTSMVKTNSSSPSPSKVHFIPKGRLSFSPALCPAIRLS